MQTLVIALTFLLSPALWAAQAPATQKPALVLVVVFDQFRADYLPRYESQFLPAKQKSGDVGGFRYLMSEGAYYPLAEFENLQCMTGPGHATILSGSNPYLNGIPINWWYDQDRKDRYYTVEDPTTPTIGVPQSAPAPKLTVSPRTFIATTVGDELKRAGYRSRVVGVSLKDRSSILMSGHAADIAIWFEPTYYSWVSSSHYLRDRKLPEWVANLNQKVSLRKGQPLVWEQSQESIESGLHFFPVGDYPDRNVKKLGKEFPHKVEIGTKESTSLPLGHELTVDAAEAALDAYQLGKGRHPDLLAVSFSSHDYLGHAYGPNSPEMAEMTLAGDRALSRLLNSVRKKVPGGLKNVLIVFTSDHGVASNPDHLKSLGMPSGRVDEKKIVEEVNARLTQKFGKAPGAGWIGMIEDLNLYLNPDAVAKKGIDRSLVEAEAKAWLEQQPWLAHAFTFSDYRARKLPPGIFERQILKTYYPGRSGDIVAIPRPDFFHEGDTVGHITGYAYDRTVPILFSGPGIKPGRQAKTAHVTDIAPTLAYLLGTLPPSQSEGRVLDEIIATGKAAK